MQPLLLIALLLLAPPAASANEGAAPPPSIGVSPSRIEATVENGGAKGVVTVLNMSARPIHVNTEVVNFDLDEANSFRELPPVPGSLPRALIVNPVEFTIPANGSQTVRFAVLPERLSGPGEHRAMLFFSEVVDTSNRALKLRFRLGVPFYANFGQVHSLANVHSVEVDHAWNQLSLDVSSIGNARVRADGYYLWWPAEAFPRQSQAIDQVRELAENPSRKPPANARGGRLIASPVFPGTRRVVTASIEPPSAAGDHVLVYAMTVGDQTVQRVVEQAKATIQVADNR